MLVEMGKRDKRGKEGGEEGGTAAACAASAASAAEATDSAGGSGSEPRSGPHVLLVIDNDDGDAVCVAGDNEVNGGVAGDVLRDTVVKIAEVVPRVA